MAKINCKKDAQEILLSLEIGGEFVIYNDNQICMINGGNTFITRVSETKFEEFSCGQNWRDQVPEPRTLEEATNSLWKSRKAVNKRAREEEKYLEQMLY